jgi:hypothetical protein
MNWYKNHSGGGGWEWGNKRSNKGNKAAREGWR